MLCQATWKSKARNTILLKRTQQSCYWCEEFVSKLATIIYSDLVLYSLHSQKIYMLDRIFWGLWNRNIVRIKVIKLGRIEYWKYSYIEYHRHHTYCLKSNKLFLKFEPKITITEDTNEFIIKFNFVGNFFLTCLLIIQQLWYVQHCFHCSAAGHRYAINIHCPLTCFCIYAIYSTTDKGHKIKIF